MAAELPTGTVTFLFTDLESSTRLWEEQPEAMRSALARHDELLTEAIEIRGGHVIKGRGDGVHAVFATADEAIAAAVDAQRALKVEPWGPIGSLRVRMGLHTGVAEQRDGDYFGPVLNRAARLMAVAHPGQVLCSHVTADLIRDSLPDGFELLDLGSHGLRDLARPEEVFQVTHPDLERDFPPLGSLDAAPGNLPPQRTNFIGRDTELAKLTKLIEQSRVVTLTGAGGVGKTRLALQAAVSLTPRFDDGTWFVDLGPTDDGSLVAGAVASAMRLPDRRQGSPEDAILASAATLVRRATRDEATRDGSEPAVTHRSATTHGGTDLTGRAAGRRAAAACCQGSGSGHTTGRPSLAAFLGCPGAEVDTCGPRVRARRHPRRPTRVVVRRRRAVPDVRPRRQRDLSAPASRAGPAGTA